MQGIPFEISSEELDNLTNQFSDTELSKLLGITISTVFLWRKRYGIQSFTQKKGCKKSRKTGAVLKPGEGVYHKHLDDLNRTYFDVIDTEKKAYFFGLLATDGHISDKNGNCFMSIELQDPDSVVIEDLIKELNFGGTFERLSRAGKKKTTSRIRVHSRDIVYSLLDKGISFEASTKTLYPNTPSGLRRHMIRGAVDGDGSITIQPDTKGFYICSSSTSLLGQVQKWVLEELDIESTIRLKPQRSGKPFYHISFKKREVVLRWLYEDCSVAIPRKKEIATIWFSRF